MKAREEGRRGDALFDQNCLHDLEHWVRTDRRRALRILKLIEVVLRDPLEDRVNRNRSADSLPAPGPGVSTRNTVLVYRVETASVRFIAARYHY